jgi:hypothetical protein
MNLRRIMSAVVIAGGVAVATPMLAANASWGQCPTDKVCLWQDTNAGGDFLGYRSPGQTWTNISAANDNRTSSWWNNTGTGARWWQLPDRGGFCVPMGAGVQRNYTEGDGFNDKLSSWASNGSSC